jgi:hypothetical protein
MPAMNYFLTIYEDLGKLTFYLLLQVGLLVSKYEDLGQLRDRTLEQLLIIDNYC